MVDDSSPEGERQRGLPEECWLSTELHGVTSQKAVIFIYVHVSTNISK